MNTWGSNVLAAELFGLFIVYLAIRGRLGTYIGFLSFDPPQDGSGRAPGEHVSGNVNSDDPATQERLRQEPDSFIPGLLGPLQPFLGGIFGGRQ